MRRLFTQNRWNWSERAKKWVFIEIAKNGKKKYKYQVEPPQEFVNLAMKIADINEKMLKAKSSETNEKLFNDLVNLSKRMQNMNRF